MTHTVLSTYRIQLHAGFDFDAAARIVDYLADLGVTHVYCSPYLQAAPGSMHGYDVVDHSSVNTELGGEKAHQWFCRALGEQGLGQVLDVVPNHMAISGPENRWWWDVLENGPSSRYASYFDVDWAYSEEEGVNRVLLPILGDHYGRIVEARQIRLERNGGGFVLRYFDHVFPVDPRSLSPIIARAGERCGSPDLEFVASALDYLPLPTATDRASTRRRHRDKQVLRVQLSRLLDEQPTVRRATDEEVEAVNADADRMDALLGRQNYRLAFWRVARSDLAYRRFFDINDLVGLRAEDEDVFLDTHELVIEWLSQGVIDGLRIDHPDGLRDPQEYFARLRRAAPGAWIVVEKILHPGERLRAAWPVQGTTGYDFLINTGQLFIYGPHRDAFDGYYQRFVGSEQPVDYHQLLQEKKDLVVSELLGSDMNRLTALATDVFVYHRRFRDFTRDEIYEALAVLVASFSVYRSYVRSAATVIEDEDVRIIDEAVATAQGRRPDLDPELFAFLGAILKLEHPGKAERELATRVQQLTGPVMAKGAEDTAFYCYTRFTALNEVGGDPARFGIGLDEFHQEMQLRAENSPAAMLATSTHDTKRSEDVRMRLAVLSETPEAWMGFCDTLREHCSTFRSGEFPDPETEYLIYQTVVGAWPIDAPRLIAYVQKAVREAKRFTSWTRRNQEYEQIIRSFVERLLADERAVLDIEQMVQSIDEAGKLNSLSLALIKLTAPGVPDVYQGNELWDYSLVDPDNRRPVDFDARRKLLRRIDKLGSEAVLRRTGQGLPKLLLTAQALRLRRRRPEVLGPAANYRPLYAYGTRADHVVAFVRAEAAITIGVRFPLLLAGAWQDTTLDIPEGRWTDLLSGNAVHAGPQPLSRLLRAFPVALLEKCDEKPPEQTGDGQHIEPPAQA
ncbi:MAG: malto-oligosyltrehalose synthase [Spirochaetaceae bacterium]|nr:MAG: malto-oligosyltrehalose synthase [Spirochaetaceae bacterium]